MSPASVLRPLCRLLLAATLLSGCAPAITRAGAAAPLRVLVYNIHAGKDAAGAHNLERVAALVRQTGADLALLQEVDRGTERSGGEDQLATLQRLTGMHGAFGRTLDYQGGEYGIAVLSRWPVQRDAVHALRVHPPQERAGGSYEPRGVLHAQVEAPGGPVHLLNTHLDASRTDQYRLQEVEQVRALADSLARSGALVLVGGDFNAEPGTAVIAHMTAAGWRDAWAACGAGEGLTFPAAGPVKRIDYLFISPDVGCRAAEVLATETSDHQPVLITLQGRERP